jgi:hypothetical protein
MLGTLQVLTLSLYLVQVVSKVLVELHQTTLQLTLILVLLLLL